MGCPTFPCLLKRLLRSAARVLEDSPLTHRFLPELQLARPGERRLSAPLRQDLSTWGISCKIPLACLWISVEVKGLPQIIFLRHGAIKLQLTVAWSGWVLRPSVPPALPPSAVCVTGVHICLAFYLALGINQESLGSQCRHFT